MSLAIHNQISVVVVVVWLSSFGKERKIAVVVCRRPVVVLGKEAKWGWFWWWGSLLLFFRRYASFVDRRRMKIDDVSRLAVVVSSFAPFLPLLEIYAAMIIFPSSLCLLIRQDSSRPLFADTPYHTHSHINKWNGGICTPVYGWMEKKTTNTPISNNIQPFIRFDRAASVFYEFSKAFEFDSCVIIDRESVCGKKDIFRTQ